MASTDFLDQKRQEIATRLRELKPLAEEYQRLEAAAAALDSVTTAASPPKARHSGRRAASAAKPRERGEAHSPRRGRPKGSGTRGAEALALITSTPGITIPELAQRMGIKQNYLYRVLPALAEDGRVVKDGRGWKPKDAGTAEAA